MLFIQQSISSFENYIVSEMTDSLSNRRNGKSSHCSGAVACWYVEQFRNHVYCRAVYALKRESPCDPGQYSC